ncbi:MAG: hypothetical protein UT05_C0001G0097 [Parcubacteria group bacterium GW2011_GWF2_38_76]|nr:MAG: hypothetical protein UT05_C0001G0097 [Parcubacteria group bacterium GW2011_GWF2_38_76]HBM45927.1 hypothetical protein [Patescibacteria group bacterium]
MTKKEKISLVLKELAKESNAEKISFILNSSSVEIKKPLDQSGTKELLKLFRKSPAEVYTDEKFLYLSDIGFPKNHNCKKISLYEALLKHNIYLIYWLYQNGIIRI